MRYAELQKLARSKQQEVDTLYEQAEKAKQEEIKKEGIDGWLGYEFESSSELTPEFVAFARDFRKAIVQNLPMDCDLVNWSRGHFYVFGFIRNCDGRFVYFSISDVRHFPDAWYNNILIRTAKHEKDYTGGVNIYTDLEGFKFAVEELMHSNE